jgi:arsenite methyltransferase
MKNDDDVKKVIKEKYSQIAGQSREENVTSCCGAGGSCSTIDYSVFAEDYTKMKGYVKDADLGLGCGIPTEFAEIRPGQTVIDLGSGAGNDVFVARTLVGEKGKVIGVDITERMIEKARENAEKLGFHNVEFRLGDIERLPVTSNIADVVVSNCVLNLVPDKGKAFSEIFRALKPGGHFSISDVVTDGVLPDAILHASEMYVGCVAGAVDKDEYLSMIRKAGFTDIRVVKEKPIIIPDEILSGYLNPVELAQFNSPGRQILSITVYGKKENCCGPDCCS